MMLYTDMCVNIVSTSYVDITTCSKMKRRKHRQFYYTFSTMYDAVDIIYYPSYITTCHSGKNEQTQCYNTAPGVFRFKSLVT